MVLLERKIEEEEVAWNCDPYRRLKGFENSVLRRIFGRKRVEVTWE
jgi:hypothetical protein